MITADIWHFFRLYKHYQNGILLHSGGLMDQPHAYLETMELVAEALNNGNQ